MNRFIFAVGFWLVSLLSSNLYGSDVMGSDLQYRCIGKDSFEFTAIVYKDCKANWAIPGGVYNLGFSGIGCSFTQTVSPSLESCTDITPVCKKSCTQCVSSQCNSSSVNTSCSFPYGIEKLVWKAIVYLGNTSCCKFRVSYIGNSTRNYAINTCCSGENFYTFLEFDRCLTPCNNSPQITNDPVAIFCVGQDICINNGAQDTIDNDSLSYHLAPALVGYGTNASYSGSYNFQRPLFFQGFPNTKTALPGGFHLDSITGDLCFRPMQQQVAVIVVEIREWRRDSTGKMILIGKTRRDMQVIIMNNCKNKNPSVDVKQTRFDVCALEQICIDIPTKDPDNPDTTRIRWNAGIPKATFSENNGKAKRAEGKFCWTPLEKDASSTPYFFNVTVWDDACPLAGSQTKTFSIVVKKIPKANRTYTYLGCGKYRVTSTPLETYNNPLYTWTVPYPGGIVYRIKDTLIQFQRGGTQVIRHTIENGGCLTPYFDTLQVPEFPSVDVPQDTQICEGKTITVRANLTHTTSAVKIRWSNGDSSISTQFTPAQSGYLSVQIVDTGSCRSSDSIFVRVLPPPVSSLGPDLKLCKKDTALLDPGNDSGRIVAWSWNNGITTQQLITVDSGSFVVTMYDSLGCFRKDTIEVFRNPYPKLQVSGNNVCQGDTAKLTASGADSFMWYSSSGVLLQTGGQQYQCKPAASTYIMVKSWSYWNGIICEQQDSVFIQVTAPPALTLRTLPDQKCISFGQYMFTVQAKDPSSGQTVNGTYQWVLPGKSCLNGSTLDLSCYGATYVWNTVPKAHYAVCVFTTPQGCVVTDSVAFTIHPLPMVDIEPRSFCASDPEVIITGTAVKGAGQPQDESWAGSGVQTRNGYFYFNPGQAGSGDHLITFQRKDQNGCENTDTATFTVVPNPVIKMPKKWSTCGVDSLLSLKDVLKPEPPDGWFVGPNIIDSIKGEIRPSAYLSSAQPVTFFYKVSSNGCQSIDSVKVLIHALPILNLTPKVVRLCEDQSTITIQADPSLIGIGQFFKDGNSLGYTNQLQINPGQYAEGQHQFIFEYLDPITLCTQRDTAFVSIEGRAQVQILALNTLCAGECLDFITPFKKANSVQWLSSGGGSIYRLNDSMGRYCPSPQDLVNGFVDISVITQSNSICAPAKANGNYPIFKAPDPTFSIDLREGCSPFETKLTITKPTAGARYYWTITHLESGVQQKDSGEILRFNWVNQSLETHHLNITCTAISVEGCDTSTSIDSVLKVYPMPKADFRAKPETMVLSNPKTWFENLTITPNPDTYAYSWIIDDAAQGRSIQRHFSYIFKSDTGTFHVTLKVTNQGGCSDSLTKTVRIVPDLIIYVPNAFTPDIYGPEANNTFHASAIWWGSFELSIYTRWGEKVYTAYHPDQGWDGIYKGKPCQDDAYAWVIRATDLAGVPFMMSGTVNLVR